MERIICHLSAEAFHWDPGWEDFSCVVTIWIGIRPRPGFGLDNTLMTASENWVACSPCDFCYPWKARQFSCPLENRVLPASFHILIERGPPFDGDRQITWCACPAMHVAHWVGLYSKSFVLWSCRKLVLIHGEKWAVWGTFEGKKKKKKSHRSCSSSPIVTWNAATSSSNEKTTNIFLMVLAPDVACASVGIGHPFVGASRQAHRSSYLPVFLFKVKWSFQTHWKQTRQDCNPRLQDEPGV